MYATSYMAKHIVAQKDKALRSTRLASAMTLKHVLTSTWQTLLEMSSAGSDVLLYEIKKKKTSHVVPATRIRRLLRSKAESGRANTQEEGVY